MGSFEFGPFRFQVATRALYRGAEFIPLTPKAAEILLMLLEEAGQVVTKEALLARVWPGVVVEEGAIANNISTLRKVFDGEFGEDGPISTVPRRGYRFAVIPAHAGTQASPAPAAAAAPAPIAARSTVLICDFDNRTGDPLFDATLRQALLLHIGQSPYLEAVGERKAHAILTALERSGEPLVGELALEVCARAGAAAAIVGTIMALGDEYILGLQAIRSTGDVIETEQARAKGKGEVLAALDRAAIGLREKLGESRLSLSQFGVPLDEIATTSLEALKAYAMGRDEWFTHGEMAAKAHQLRAIELDPQFVSAYSALAIACDNMGQSMEALQYMQKAYDLRERTTEIERMRLEGTYHSMVTGDRYKSLDAYRMWSNMRPSNAIAMSNTGWVAQMLGQWEMALEWQQRAIAVEATSVTVNNLALCLMATGRVNEARGVLDDAFARGPCPFYITLDAYLVAFLRGDKPEMVRYLSMASSKGGEEDYMLAAQADTAAYEGDHARARTLTRRAVASAKAAGVIEMAACWEALGALREAELGNHEFAREHAATAHAMATGRTLQPMCAYVLARSGAVAEALAIEKALHEAYPQDTIIQRYWIPCMHAAIAIGKREWETALDALEIAQPLEFGHTQPFEYSMMLPVWLRAVALEGAGRKAEALRERQAIQQRPGMVKNFIVGALAR